MKISPNKFEENSKSSKAHMNMNIRTLKSTYMKVQVRTINLNKTKRQKTQNQSVDIQQNYKQHGN